MKSKDPFLDRYAKLLLIREAEIKIKKEYFKDQIKTPVHLSIGSEAIAVGVTQALPAHTRVLGTYRNHSWYLALSEDLFGFFCELLGRIGGCASGIAGSMHMSLPEKGLLLTSAVVASTIPIAVGVALSNQYQGKEDLVVVFFGDGATEEGVFWESINFACLNRLRILFVCEDNELAIHTPKSQRQSYRSLREALSGFPCLAETGDGRDVNQVFQLTESLVSRIQKNPQPAVVSFPYFRFLQHVGIEEDFLAGYRERPENLKEQDPVFLYEQTLLTSGYSQSSLIEVANQIQKQIENAFEKALEQPFLPMNQMEANVCQ